MSRVFIIINPVSGPARRGRGREREEIARRTFARHAVRGEIRLTEGTGHAYEMALEAAAMADVDLLIAWGGDGTINEVGRAIVQATLAGREAGAASDLALGIIPGGSGNGLARELKIAFDPVQAIQHAITARSRQIDAGELGNRLFFNIAGMGLDAHVAALVSTRNIQRGFLPYLMATMGDLVRYRPTEYVIEADGGRRIETAALFVAIANSRQYGFGAHIAPRAALDDGCVDVVIVEDRGLTGNVARIPSLFSRQVDQQPGIHTLRAREATIRSAEAMLFHVDGEAIQGSDTLVARVHPRALRLRA
jgi:YegS/Rv2252/BmrU family lipid kinase